MNKQNIKRRVKRDMQTRLQINKLQNLYKLLTQIHFLRTSLCKQENLLIINCINKINVVEVTLNLKLNA